MLSKRNVGPPALPRRMRRGTILLFFGFILLYGCGKGNESRTPAAANFECHEASAHYGRYGLSWMSNSEVDALISDSALDISLPKDLMGLAISGAAALDNNARRGVVLDLGADVDREGVAAIFSPASSPACSGPPSSEPVFTTDEGIQIYPFQFSNAVNYIAWFRPSGALAVELSVWWVPHKEPPVNDQRNVVKRWITAFYEANKN